MLELELGVSGVDGVEVVLDGLEVDRYLEPT